MPPVISDTTVFVDELANQTTGVSLIAEVRLVDGSGLVAPPMEVRTTPFIMGRGTDASLCVADDQVSRHHCQIDREGGNYVIRDLGSTNGTFLNGVRVLLCRLHPGDQLQIGSSQILFSLGYRFGGQ
ncbi:MAG: FHA domain-containing protein [Myxococcota bacterium]|nr:FHA domain-containing protein [Myxococcota bacterium]